APSLPPLPEATPQGGVIMARIKIEALRPGARPRSFRPSLEGLEDRQLLASHMAAALLVSNPPALDPAYVGQLTPGAGHDLRPRLMQDQQLTNSVQADRAKVVSEAERFLKEHIIGDGLANGRMSNRWGLSKDSRLSISKVEVVGQEIKVSFEVYYRNETDPCRVQLNFAGKNEGGAKVYRLVGAGLHDYKYSILTPFGDPGAFEAVAKELFNNKMGGKIECHRFDETTFANNVVRQAEKLYGVKEGTFQKNFVERIDGGFKVLMYTDNNPFNPMQNIDSQDLPVGRGEIWLTFKYDDAQLAKGSVQVSEIRQGYHWQKYDRTIWIGYGRVDYYSQQWHDTGDANVHARMREAAWSLPA